MRQITVAIAGCGGRGLDTYAAVAKQIPEEMKIVAAADLLPERLEKAKREFDLTDEQCFSSVEDLLEQRCLADVLFICTQDRQHVSHAIPAIKKGYHVLLEKPVSPDAEECRALLREAEKYQRQVAVCHVLRYTPFFRKVKELVDSGKIGKVVDVQALENVGYWHAVHSFVRGNWSNTKETSPMILAKCCHDLDILVWLAGGACKAVSSFGGTALFKPEQAPEGAATRCTDCRSVKAACPYDAEKIYLTNSQTGVLHGNTGWPCNVLQLYPTEENIRKALREGPYGRCVYHCSNDTVDHQIVAMEMDNGVTISLTMCAFTSKNHRYLKIMGTTGDIEADMGKNTIEITPFGDMPEVIDVSTLSDDFSGHGGGDAAMVKEFIRYLAAENDKRKEAVSSGLEASLESHYIALAAEYSRLHGGEAVAVSKLRE